MRKLFCLDKRAIKLTDIADHLQKHLGLSLRVKPGSTELHGVLFGNHFRAGYKEPMENNKGTYWCNENLDEGEHTCVILVLHEREENTEGAIIQKPHPKLHEVHHRIPGHVDTFAKNIGATTCHHDAESLKNHLDFFVGLR